jgi:hypothetical protein
VWLADADALDVAGEGEEFADDWVVVELGRVGTDGRELGGSVNGHVVDVGPVADRLEGQPVLCLEPGHSEGVDAPFDHGKGALIGDALGGPAHRLMVGMPGDALWLEDDERSDVGAEPAVDVRVELGVGKRIERPVGEVEQRDVRDAQDLGGVEELPAANVAKAGAGTDGAGFAVRKAQDAYLTPLASQVGEERPEPEGFVVGVRDHRGDGTPQRSAATMSCTATAGSTLASASRHALTNDSGSNTIALLDRMTPAYRFIMADRERLGERESGSSVSSDAPPAAPAA